MSDGGGGGGGESGREGEQQTPHRKSGGDKFAQALAKVAIAQICEGTGFQAFQQPALETLSDVAMLYIRNIGKTAHLHANSAGRTECNVFDIIRGLEDLGLAPGFLGASVIDHCLASSGTVREITQYIGEADEIPFSYSISQFPVVKVRKPMLSFLQIGEEPPDEHIPAWLPAFPELNTYIQSPTQNERELDTYTERVEQVSQDRKVERSLLNLQQRFAFNRPEGPFSVDLGDDAKAKRAAESNPFLAPPLQFGEKEVSRVSLPVKISDEAALENHVSDNRIIENQVMDNRVSVLESFVPAIEAMKSSLCDTEAGQKKVLLNGRPVVKFKIGIGKKSLGSSLASGLQKKGVDLISPWFGNNEKDDRKRKAEKILKESMENPQELAQL